MTRYRHWIIALGLSVLIAQTAGADSTAAAEALVLIEELGLRASPTPMSDRPDWKPKKVAVVVASGLGHATSWYEQALQAAVGDTELVLIQGQPSEALLASIDGLIGICTPTVLQQAGSQLRWIHHYFVGMDMCKGATEEQLQKIVFTNNKRLSGPAIAEHTIAMLLALTHNLPGYYKAQRQSKFNRAPATKVTFGELQGKTILVVGLGGIGTEIAWRAHGLGMRVIATRRSSRTGPDYVDTVGLPEALHELAGEADVIVNALPLTPETAGIFDKDFFDAVKPGAIFLSVGRGKSTVTGDLIAALESGKLFGAGLDVTDPEPLPKDSPLWSMPNVIITPHVSAAGPDSNRRSMIIAVENLRRYVSGEAMLNVVNLRLGY
ncbi:MAG: D-2-hydroxyacid dehydrogenase [Halioglobus sp.]|nr:D-2-hydroxyacid dehydrogenase [Halioglobus sp.]